MNTTLGHWQQQRDGGGDELRRQRGGQFLVDAYTGRTATKLEGEPSEHRENKDRRRRSFTSPSSLDHDD